MLKKKKSNPLEKKIKKRIKIFHSERNSPNIYFLPHIQNIQIEVFKNKEILLFLITKRI